MPKEEDASMDIGKSPAEERRGERSCETQKGEETSLESLSLMLGQR